MDFNIPEDTRSNIQIALQMQMNTEFNNYRIYKNLAGIADSISLTGACKWLNNAANEELDHFNRFNTYICDRGWVPQMMGLVELPSVKLSLFEMFQAALITEKMTTDAIIALKKLAFEDGDMLTYDFLDWFTLEQVDSEKTVGDIVNRLTIVGSDGTGILLIDKELGED
jgi:ferritin